MSAVERVPFRASCDAVQQYVAKDRSFQRCFARIHRFRVGAPYHQLSRESICFHFVKHRDYIFFEFIFASEIKNGIPFCNANTIHELSYGMCCPNKKYRPVISDSRSFFRASCNIGFDSAVIVLSMVKVALSHVLDHLQPLPVVTYTISDTRNHTSDGNIFRYFCASYVRPKYHPGCMQCHTSWGCAADNDAAPASSPR